MADFVEDSIAWPTMVSLAACICTTVADRGLPSLCQCAVVPGPEAVMDACGSCSGDKDACGGQAWVRLVNEYPSSQFPSPDALANNCDSPMAYVLEFGIARCLPVGKGNNIVGYTPPTLEQMVDATRLQMADKSALRAALKCCLGENDITYSLGQYQPLQITGDCGGGYWTAVIWGVS